MLRPCWIIREAVVLLLVVVKTQVLVCMTTKVGAASFSFNQQVATASGCAYGRYSVRILEYATLTLTEHFVGRREITSIRAGNRVFGKATWLLAREFVV